MPLLEWTGPDRTGPERAGAVAVTIQEQGHGYIASHMFTLAGNFIGKFHFY